MNDSKNVIFIRYGFCLKDIYQMCPGHLTRNAMGYLWLTTYSKWSRRQLFNLNQITNNLFLEIVFGNYDNFLDYIFIFLIFIPLNCPV